MTDLTLSPRPHSDLLTDVRLPLHVRTLSSPLSEILTFNGEEEQEEEEPPMLTGAMTKQKRKRWKKPADHPKRPLSAYNLFFQWGRERLLAGESLVPLQQEDIDQIDVDTRRNSKRRHRREHGVIGFTELAKMLGTKWKELDPESKEMFQKRADVEKARYEKAVSLYKAEKGENQKEDEEQHLDKTPSGKPKRLSQKAKKMKNVPPQSTKGVTDGSSKQKLSLREEAERIQPLTYDAPSSMYRQMGTGQLNQALGIYSSSYRGDNEHFYYEQQGAFQSENQVNGIHPEMSTPAQNTKTHNLNHMAHVRPNFMPQATNQANYIQSNPTTMGSESSIRDYNESMGTHPVQGMQSMWDTGNIPNISSPAFHSLTNQAYNNNTNYFDPSVRHWPAPRTDVPNHSYYTMPSLGQTMRNNPSVLGMQHSSMYSQYPQFPASFPRYPSMEPFSGQSPTNLLQLPMYQGMREDVDGLSSTSPLNYFD